ncbi:MAG TPA: MarR family transcriptional regulator [Acidimicrobiales bacterium]|nr:MarR family transcriptional regulator [Acidimicrobiales bacterium]
MTSPPPTGPFLDDNDLISRLRLALLRLSRRLRQNAAAGVTPSQLSVLATLGGHGPMSLGDLASHEGVQPPSVTRMVAALEEAGLVSRVASTVDRRSVMAELTESGTQTVNEIRRRRDAWLAQRLGALEPEQLEALRAALPVLESMLAEPPVPES